MSKVSSFLLLLMTARTVVSAADWPTHMGDTARSGIAREALPPPLSEAWSFRTPLPPQPAWPDAARWDGWHKVYDLKTRMTFDRCYHVVASGDRVFFGSSSSDQLYCLDARTGERKWSFFAEGPIRLAPTLDSGRVVFGSDDGHVYCLEAATGTLVWRHRPSPRDLRVPGNGRIISVWPVRGGVVIREGTVYGACGVFPSTGVFVFALRLEDGAEVWKSTLNDLPVQGYLLASATRLYAPTGRNNPVVFDRQGGAKLRVVSGQGGTYALLAGDQLIFGPGRTGQLGLVEPGEKDQLATFNGNHMIVTPGVSYLHTDTELSALDRARYLTVARQRRTLAARRSQLTEALKKLGKANADTPEAKRHQAELAELAAKIRALEGEMKACLRWRSPCKYPFALVLAGETLYAGGEGAVAALGAADGRVAWSGAVAGRVLGLAVANGRLFASTDRGGVHCFTRARAP